MSFQASFRKIRAIVGGIVLGPLLYFLSKAFILPLDLPDGFMPEGLEIVLLGLFRIVTLPFTMIFSIKGVSILDIVYWIAIVWFCIWANDVRLPKKGDAHPKYHA